MSLVIQTNGKHRLNSLSFKNEKNILTIHGKMSSSTQDEPFKVIWYYFKILGINPFQLNNSNLLKRSTFSTVYTTILCFIYSIVFVFVTKNGYKNVLVQSSPMSIIADALGMSFNGITIFSIWIISLLRVDKIKKIIQKFKETSLSLNKLGIFENIGLSIELLEKLCVIINILFYVHLIVSCCIMFLLGYDTYLGWLWYDLGLGVLPNTIVIFFTAMTLMKERFKKINQLVVNLSGVNKSTISVSHVRSIGEIHANLRELLDMITNLFSLPIIFLLATGFMEFAACGYMAYNKFKDDDSQKWETRNISTVLNLMGWVLIHFLQMVVVIDVSSSTVREANKTGAAIHQAIPTKIVEMVSLRLLQQPAKISLHGFIELDFTLLYSIIKTITSFIVIMLQLDEQARESAEFMTMLQSPDDNDTDYIENSSNFDDVEYLTNNYDIIS